MNPSTLLLRTPALVDRAGAWFLASGIQEESGGVARYYRSDLGRNARISTEITGYTVSALVWLHRLAGEARYLDAALRAGRFLCQEAWDSGLRTFPFEYPTEGVIPPAYFFDCGIIVRGLLRLFHATGDAAFLDVAQACGESMAADFPCERGYHPILQLPEKTPQPCGGSWSNQPGCFHLKAALAWRELFDETGEDAWQDHFLRAVRLSLASHSSFLPDPRGVEKTMDRLHAFCYFLEGLLACGDDPAAVQALAHGIQRAAAYHREIAPRFERADVPAQILRVRIHAAALGLVPLDEKSAAEEAERAASCQLESGGFCFGSQAGRRLPYVNPVSTAFCVQALEAWRQYKAGEFRAEVRELI